MLSSVQSIDGLPIPNARVPRTSRGTPWVVVSADHGTSCLTGNHTADPVPLLVANWSDEGEPERFDEESAENGVIGLIHPGDLSNLLFPADGVYGASPDL